jgi:hypothetical protein
MWNMVHCAIAVNKWRAKISINIPILCICCNSQAEETVLHRMIMCPRAQYVWKYALTILYSSQAIPPVNGRWAFFTWQ